ncbi:hypothetical protein DPMN_113892 [Dreissena polymorpha]|uniref:Uncharacterized protein n=1 Tax=Dreissena polymorpha TaxID=45954 RepID=A0A9D4KIA9_DREPO|nr:hypothetical protein DPMN_113892 [Dreissena polymorpha]
MVPRPSGHLQETLRMSATLPLNLPDRRGTRRRLLDSLRRCQDRLGSCRRLPDGAKSLQDRQGTFRRIPDSLRRCEDRLGTSRILKDGLPRRQNRIGTCRRLSDSLWRCQAVSQIGGVPAEDPQTVYDVARKSLRPEGTCRRLQDSLWRCQDRKNTYRRFPNCLRCFQTVSQTGRAHARDSHTFCDVPRPSGQLQETPRQSVTVPDSLALHRSLFANLLQVPGRSWHRRKLSGSLLQVPRRTLQHRILFVCLLQLPRWSWHRRRLSLSPCKCPTGLGICQGVSGWCPESLVIVAYCLRVYCRCPDGLGELLALPGSLLQVP